ncbi:MAG TPA: ABC transporter permease [Firmicutes bacterium]|nr:ABC transporter permease [Candidatus Fermentithermobacillaceae bacterium]
MRRYLTRRFLLMIPMLFGVTMISFLIMNLAPGDPTSFYVDPLVGQNDPEMLAIVRKSLGLDKPLPVRYALWLGKTIKGDLGFSFISRRPVMDEIRSRIGNTLLLASVSMVISLVVGVLIGVWSAVNQYKMSDYVLTVLAFIGVSMPSFWFAMMLILFLTGKLKLLPSVGMNSINVPPGFFNRFMDTLAHMVMPVLVMSLSSIARWARYQRSSMLEVIRQDFIRTARAKGLPQKKVIFKHALRNAAIPIITLLGMSLPSLIGGSFIIETVFGWPGMGRLGVNAIFNRDYPVVMGVTLFSSILVMVGNLAADVLYAVVDPRIRYR